MIDVELAWVWSHHDLPTPFYQGGSQSSTHSHRDQDHGTAVMGEIAAIENDFGITGIASQAAVGGQAIDIGSWPENVGTYFDQASAALEPGDVWLIELHGPGPDEAYVPMEWWQSNYDAIANSTALGRICVEAGGNGSANMDAAIYEGKFDRTIRDSLAIMVGAGTPYDMVPEWFTNYGSRMDVNGWGSAIYSTGYGDLYSSEGENLYYTSLFGGTSGASPIVVGVCCVAQSIYKELTGSVISPEDMRSIITETGAPQPSPITQQIGPRPNLAALLEHDMYNVQGIYLDNELYSCSAEALVTVRHPGVIPPVFATISSTTEPTGEILTLLEIEPGIFALSIQLTENPPQTGDELLSVSNGDIITAEYAGLSDSTTATVDCLAPVITTVTVTEIRDSQAAISWQTNEPATSVIHYGTGIPDETVVSNDLTTNHSLVLENLDECTLYVF
ncbi:S8 family serine peptidase, partial [bacterium]|nr:S8 family serine peptidase [bacterium]